MKRRMAWMAIAIVTTLIVTGCQKSTDKGTTTPPGAQPGQGQGPTGGNEKPPASQPLTAVAIPADQAPAALREWAATQANAAKPAYKAVTEGDASYLAVTGGLQSSGGYKVEVTGVSAVSGGVEVKAQVVPPPPGSVNTTALTNPVGYFKLPKVEGSVTATVASAPVSIPQGPGPKADVPLTVGVRWAEPGRLEITGTAPQPDLSFVLLAGSTKLGQADVQVKNGRFIGNILATPPKSAPELTLSVRTPDGKELRTLPVDAATPADEVASANFRVKSARRTAPDTVTVEGRARAFEAVFRVEIRAGGKVLAQVPVKADIGAPEFGHFKADIKVAGGVPDGAEAWFLIVSAKDGSTTAELSIPITNP